MKHVSLTIEKQLKYTWIVKMKSNNACVGTNANTIENATEGRKIWEHKTKIYKKKTIIKNTFNTKDAEGITSCHKAVRNVCVVRDENKEWVSIQVFFSGYTKVQSGMCWMDTLLSADTSLITRWITYCSDIEHNMACPVSHPNLTLPSRTAYAQCCTTLWYRVACKA